MFSFVSRRHCRLRPVLFTHKSISNTTSLNAVPHPLDVKREAFVPKAQQKSKNRRPNFSRELRLEFEKHKNEVPLISCRRREFDFYEGMKYGKFSPIPLVSQTWESRKSNGDYFTIYQGVKFSSDDFHFGNLVKGNSSELRFIEPYQEDKFEEQSTFTDFANLGIGNELCNSLKQLGVNKAADIQVAAIPIVLTGKNSLISAHTGCGKTLAYLLPVIQKTLNRNYKTLKDVQINSPSTLIITPSRELAEQIHDVLLKVTEELPISSSLFIGGYLRGKLANPKKKAVDILVGSLGALNKAFAAGVFQLDRISHVVLDEADQLLDDSNERAIINILRKIRFQHNSEFIGHAQMILVSATMPLNLQKRFNNILAVESLERITTQHLHHLPLVPQRFLKVGKIHKGKVLLDLVEQDVKKGHSILIFR